MLNDELNFGFDSKGIFLKFDWSFSKVHMYPKHICKTYCNHKRYSLIFLSCCVQIEWSEPNLVFKSFLSQFILSLRCSKILSKGTKMPVLKRHYHSCCTEIWSFNLSNLSVLYSHFGQLDFIYLVSLNYVNINGLYFSQARAEQ